MQTIEATTEIRAPAARVWEILTAFEAYRSWNPFITAAEGDPVVGDNLRVRIEPPGSRSVIFRPTVTEVAPNERLSWRGRLFVPGLFDGRHSFTIDSLSADRVWFTQRETFSGLLVPVLLDAASVTAGFEAMNEALKARAEGIDVQSRAVTA